MKPYIRHVMGAAPGCIVGAMLAHFDVPIFSWQFWGWLIGIALALVARDFAEDRK